MKPILIFAEKNDDGKVFVSKEELKRIVDEAYAMGRADANTWTNPMTITPTWTDNTAQKNPLQDVQTSELKTTIYGTAEA